MQFRRLSEDVVLGVLFFCYGDGDVLILGMNFYCEKGVVGETSV